MNRTTRRRIPIYQVDAFTDEPFKGNPAAVCILQSDLQDEIMQKIAAEMNLSETAFVHSLEKKLLREARIFSLRWFTPEVEVPLCGHATLATAAVLFREANTKANEIQFKTKSGTLTAQRAEKGICLNLPSDNLTRIEPPKPLLRAIGVRKFGDIQYGEQTRSLLIRLPSQKEVHSLAPDYQSMKSISIESDISGVIITADGSPTYDFISRFFAPWVGINEDPVTGAAHTVLAPYWSKQLGKREMKAHQASARGGELSLKVKPNNTVDLIGNAVLVFEGQLYLH